MKIVCPYKPSNSHYTESPRAYPGIFECRWACDPDFFEFGWACHQCASCCLGQFAPRPCNASGDSDTPCSACPPPPTGAYFPVPGSCAWNCTADYVPAAGGYAPCAASCDAGYYRGDCGAGGDADAVCRPCSNASCVPCAKRPADRVARFFAPNGAWAEVAVRSHYTDPRSWRSRDCPWTCKAGYYGHAELGCAACTNRPNPLLPVASWACAAAESGGTVCRPLFVNSSYYTGPGGFGANDCPWSCSAGYSRTADDCVQALTPGA